MLQLMSYFNKLKLEHVIHFYIGCSFLDVRKAQEKTIIGIKRHSTFTEIVDANAELIDTSFAKLYLRSMEDMTDEEALMMGSFLALEGEFKDAKLTINKHNDKIISWSKGRETFNATGELLWSADMFHYLTQQGFDLFDLIEKGQAIRVKEKRP